MSYSILASVADSCLRRCIHFTMDDFSTLSSCDEVSYKESVNPHGFRIDAADITAIIYIAKLSARMQVMQPRSLTVSLSTLVGRSSRNAGFLEYRGL